jgi:hypothetical protein
VQVDRVVRHGSDDAYSGTVVVAIGAHKWNSKQTGKLKLQTPTKARHNWFIQSSVGCQVALYIPIDEWPKSLMRWRGLHLDHLVPPVYEFHLVGNGNLRPSIL